ncbi:MAG: serine/threonine-protein phosphatase [Bifidobacterium sp.]|nr:serine/threonine-protein phosphatase [Bifidobacterium sp.]
MIEGIDAADISDIGLRRPTNQDCFVAADGVYVVCDGMGGAQAGERASAIAAEEMARLETLDTRTRADVRAALDAAQGRDRALGVSLGGIAGTTVTGIVCAGDLGARHGRHAGGIVDAVAQVASFGDEDPDATVTSDGTLERVEVGDDATLAPADGPAGGEGAPAEGPGPVCFVVNVGDSRTYHLSRFPDGSLNEQSFLQLTHDHSRRQEAIDHGMDEQVATRTIARNVITQCVGAPGGIRPDIVAVRARGRFIICSDGLHGEVDDATIASIGASHADAREAAAALVDAALRAGGSDNVTVIVVDMPYRAAAPVAVAPEGADVTLRT